MWWMFVQARRIGRHNDKLYVRENNNNNNNNNNKKIMNLRAGHSG